jgi:hypothetical protein
LLFMKRLMAVFLFALAMAAAIHDAKAVEGPNLIISAIAGNLETGQAGTLMIEISNNAIANQTQTEQDELGVERSKALAIMAQLISRDDRLKVLSDAQPGGSLAAGENRTLLFAVLPQKEAELGIYPLEMLVSYSNLTDIALSEDQSLVFIYENATKMLPLEAKVSLGPKIILKDIKGTVVPGKESLVQVVISNQGDEIANDLQLDVEVQEPFLDSTVSSNLGDLRPGKSACAQIKLEAQNALRERYYALPARISYITNGFNRKEDTAIILEVKNQSWLSVVMLPTLALLLISAGIYIVVRIFKKPQQRRKR